MNLKKLNLTVLLVTILVLVPTIQIVYASPLSTFYLSGGIYPQATYTVWKEGSYYYAKNAYGFQPSWSKSTNASFVIQKAINATNVYGGTVKIASGQFILTKTIELQPAVFLVGSGKEVKNKGTVLVLNTDIDGIRVMRDLVDSFQGTKISDLTIWANSTTYTHSGIVIEQSGAWGLWLDNLNIWRSITKSHTGVGITLTPPNETDVGIMRATCSNTYIQGFEIGIYFHVAYNKTFVNDNYFTNVDTCYCGIGVYLHDSYGTEPSTAGYGINHNSFINVKAYGGTGATWATHAWLIDYGTANTLLRCFAGDLTVDSYGLAIGNDSLRTVISYGSMPHKFENNGTGTILQFVRYLYTEDWGVETFPNGVSSYSFEHDLGGQYTSFTPNHVEVGWKEDIGGLSWYWSANTTHLNITLSGASSDDWDFSWNAEYVPA